MNLKFLNKSQVLRKYDIFYKTRILTDTGLEQRYENLKKNHWLIMHELHIVKF